MNGKLFGYGLTAAAAITLLCLAPVTTSAQMARRGEDSGSMAATPRTADGHPDLTGVWNGPMGMGGGVAAAPAEPDDKSVIKVALNARGGSLSNFERDNSLVRRMDLNKPEYKPQYWSLVQSLDQTGNDADPEYTCMPDGLPRKGPPVKIIQEAKETIFLYQNPDMFRIIPTDGRAHSPDDQLEGTWYGESIGHWEGDTFVVDTVGFNNTSWLGIAGWIHGDNLHVIERVTRQGNQLTWQATAEDPDYFLKPWVLKPVVRRLNTTPGVVLDESLPCSERDIAHLVTHEHH
jgi:hypothetical protein